MMQMSALTRSQPAPFQPAGVSAIRSVQPQHCQRLIAARGMGGSPQQMAEMMQKMMQNPEMAGQLKAMQEAMKNPEIQKAYMQQMQQMQSVMQSQQLKDRMESLKNDPEFAHVFADIQKNGMGALMKYYNDPEFLTKFGAKVGNLSDVQGAAAAAPQAAAAAQAEPEINSLLDAAKYGDEEAVEDFIAIGKDANEADAQGRTPMHYAAAYERTIIAEMLMDAGAKLEMADTLANTPLHYAAGYGRPLMVKLLVNAGADKTAKNNTGKTALDLAKMDERNPLYSNQEILALLA